MRWANMDGERRKAEPGGKGTCPGCGSPVIAKCGRIVVWHWAHATGKDCDPWYEPESEWHRDWKDILAPPEKQEVTMGCHRADVVGRFGTVIELQHGSLSPDDIEAREAFYGRMVWLVDGRDFFDRFWLRTKNGYMTFQWVHPRRSWAFAKKPITIDFGGFLFNVRKLHDGSRLGGWGVKITKADFVRRYGVPRRYQPDRRL